jgi:alpha-methylacyl-CoA racemase
MAEREVFVRHDGVLQPAPAPRFSRTPSAIRPTVADDLAAVVKEWAQGR